MQNKKRWIRISLRTFLVLITCAAIGVAGFANYARTRKAAFAAVRQAGGEVRMAYGEPSQLEKWFGPEVFGAVAEIDMRKGSTDNELLKHIGKLSELRRLNLSSVSIDDEGLRLIAHLPLEELWLQRTQVTDSSAETLSKMKTLYMLSLNATSVTDAFLEQLQALPNLQVLGLRGSQVSGVGMKSLARHPNLMKLDVYQTQVDDSGVGHLVACQSLTGVGLSMTKVTNAVFEHLDKLPNLTDADLSANDLVTTEAVLAFEKSHPKCDIEWYGK